MSGFELLLIRKILRVIKLLAIAFALYLVVKSAYRNFFGKTQIAF